MNQKPDLIRMGQKQTQDDIIVWLRALRAHACTPFSGYKVSGIVETRYGDGYLYFAGVNVENEEPGLSTHGEEGAIAAMVTAMGKSARASAVWVMGAAGDLTPENHGGSPAGSCCGRCRQRIAGFADADVPVHSVALGGDVSTHTVAALLPDSFSFANLPGGGVGSGEGLLAEGFTPQQIKKRLVREAPQSEAQIFEWLDSLYPVDQASGIAQSAVLAFDNGFYAAGVRIEDAAYTGINAVQVALAVGTAAFGRQRIGGVWSLSKAADESVLAHAAVQPLPATVIQITGPNVPTVQFSADGTKVFASAKDERTA